MIGPVMSASARIGSVLAIGLLMGPGPCRALEERVEDLTASVEVAAVFRLTLDKPNLAFHDVSPGRPKILGESRWFNEIRCRSNSGRPWYLKAQVVSLKHMQGGDDLPLSSLQWKVADFTGSGELVGAASEFHPFSDVPTMIYASRDLDDRGQEVVLRLQYSLATPPDALAGSYAGQVVFTMVENP